MRSRFAIVSRCRHPRRKTPIPSPTGICQPNCVCVKTVEDTFKLWKDPHFVSWRPLLHWTDLKVRVHAAYCMFALLLSSLLLREVRTAAITTGLAGLLQTLAGITAVVDLPRDDSRRRTVPVSIRLTRREPNEERLFQLLGLQRFHPEVPATKIGATG